LAGKCFHPVNPVHPVQNVFLIAALPGCGLFRFTLALLPGGSYRGHPGAVGVWQSKGSESTQKGVLTG
jgi:hypothetical protein